MSTEAHAPSADVPGPLVPRRCWAICFAAVPLHLALALGTELSPDEAYYLWVARGASALPRMPDHPPLVAWMLRLTDIAGPIELRVRVWAIGLTLATALAAVALARVRGADERGAEATAWIASFAILPTAGGFVTTPDTPLLFLFMAALLLSARERPLVAGLSLALAACAKVVAFPIAAVLAAADRRMRLPALACLVALPFAVPSLRFQLRHAFVDAPAPWSLSAAAVALPAAAAAQLALWSPPALFRGLGALWRTRGPDALLVAALSALLVVSALARATPPEPNWWAPAGLLVAVAASRADASRARPTLLVALLAPTALIAAHAIHPFLPLARSVDPTARLHGWRSGPEPLDAPGIGAYGTDAERCVYRKISCDKLISNFER